MINTQLLRTSVNKLENAYAQTQYKPLRWLNGVLNIVDITIRNILDLSVLSRYWFCASRTMYNRQQCFASYDKNSRCAIYHIYPVELSCIDEEIVIICVWFVDVGLAQKIWEAYSKFGVSLGMGHQIHNFGQTLPSTATFPSCNQTKSTPKTECFLCAWS